MEASPKSNLVTGQPLAVHQGQATSLSRVQMGIDTVRETMDALKAIRTFIHEEFREDLDYGVIPGTGTKPALLQPGAQKTAMYFNATPDHQIERHELGNGHVEFVVTTRLIHRGSGSMIGSGIGSCTTMESKYRWRKSGRACPKCGSDAIIAGRPEYGGGWICYGKKGGCGAKFVANDRTITGQETGRVVNTDIYDVRNTVLKMATKRSFVAASLSLGCLAELFTQDIDETYDMSATTDVNVTISSQDEGKRETRASIPDLRSPGPPAVPVNNHSGYATGKYASPEQVEAYRVAALDFCRDRNARWADEWADERGELPEGIKEVVHPHQLTWHLLKWGIRTRRLADVGLTVDPETNKLVEKCSIEQAKKYVAIVFGREPEAVAAEAEEYFRLQADEARLEWREKHEDESGERDDDGGEGEGAADDAREG